MKQPTNITSYENLTMFPYLSNSYNLYRTIFSNTFNPIIMDAKTIKLLDFARELNPRLDEMYEIYTNPMGLIGKTVYANRSGFSCGGEGGTEMIVESIVGNNVRFLSTANNPTKDSWGTELDILHLSIRLNK